MTLQPWLTWQTYAALVSIVLIGHAVNWCAVAFYLWRKRRQERRESERLDALYYAEIGRPAPYEEPAQ